MTRGGSVEAYLRQVDRLFGDGTLVGMSDAQLLERFVSGRDEDAFQVLLARHGPMVLGVCRSVLEDASEAEDAFQATFLILIRKARSLWVQGSLGSWLYRVARRVAHHARKEALARRRREKQSAEMKPKPVSETASAELRAVLYEEVDRLPAHYRSPVVLCLLEGLTHEEAARQLRWPVGTVSGRLSRARETLRRRLTRRGVAVPVGALTAALFSQAAPAAVPAPLAHTTVRLAFALLTNQAAAVSATTAGALTEGVMRAMLRKTVRWTVVALLAVATTTTGVVVLAQPKKDVRRGAPFVDDRPKKGAAPVTLSYGDHQSDGKKSLGGSGEMIEFTRPEVAGLKVTGLKIHGARYGQPNAPDEQFLIYFLDESRGEVVATLMAPYSLFERGEERWVEVKFAKPVEVPTHFWVALDFRAQQTKGVYVSYDASTGGKHSRIGLPGIKPQLFGAGDWMIELNLAAEPVQSTSRGYLSTALIASAYFTPQVCPR